MSKDITIEIDGKPYQTQAGKMLIEVTDENGIYIPRFCYHKKLSVAANCRMCLIEVEKAPKPLPACATPVADGMKVSTQSSLAREAQKAVMEFLLINHPLDCPICDQGGECELQDISMGFGSDISRYTEGKRSVDDENLGPLISTDMTRCIHCTRCVRFGDEIAGLPELGMTGRGENSRIGTYIEHSMSSEVSANIIDLCPVGALTNKPYRFSARAWELTQHSSLSPHDCLGTHLYLHTRRDKIMRVVPKAHESINETWIADRDRFGCLGTHSKDRLTVPKIKLKGHWVNTSWENALDYLSVELNRVLQEKGPEQLAGFIAPHSTTEECYLFQKVLRHIGCLHIDHRLQQTDFLDQDHLPVMPTMKVDYASIENQHVILIVGSHLRHEQPLAALKVRKATKQGAKICVVNPIDYEFNFPLTHKAIQSPAKMVMFLAELTRALYVEEPLPRALKNLLEGIKPSETAKAIAKQLKFNENTMILAGAHVHNHPHASVLRTLLRLIVERTKASLVPLTSGGNTAGACLAGALPHRSVGGNVLETSGMDIKQCLEQERSAYFLFNVEPEFDCANPSLAKKAMRQADCVVAMTPYASKELLAYAHVLLPITPFTENSGHMVNVEGTWQFFRAAVNPLGEARPGWKVLRVLGNLFEMDQCDYQSLAEVKKEIDVTLKASTPVQTEPYFPKELPKEEETLQRIGYWPIYAIDAMVRRSIPLQQSATCEKTVARMNQRTATKYQWTSGNEVNIKTSTGTVTLPFVIDDKIADNCVAIPTASEKTISLGPLYAEVEVSEC